MRERAALFAGQLPVARRRDELTEREHEVLRMLANGISDQEIATALVVSDATVRSHGSQRQDFRRPRDLEQLQSLVRARSPDGLARANVAAGVARGTA